MKLLFDFVPCKIFVNLNLKNKGLLYLQFADPSVGVLTYFSINNFATTNLK